MRRYILLIPGPTASPDYVLSEMAAPVLPHYESEWAEIYWEIVGDLQKIMGTKSDVFPLNGSGTLAVDLAMASLLQDGDKVLSVANCHYGRFMGEAAESFGARVTYLPAEMYRPVSSEMMNHHLEEDAYKLVVAAHHDTASGFLNPLHEIGSICRERKVPFLVDCVSSIGGVPFKMDEWGVDFACASVQKALDCPAGLAIVGVSRRGWREIEKAGDLKRGRYMSLQNWRRSVVERKNEHPNLVSVGTNNMMGLRASLKHILSQGIEYRMGRYQRIGEMIRRGARNMGLETLVEDRYAPLLTRIVFPHEADCEDARSFVRHRYGILVGTQFRVAHFGAGVSADTITLLLVAIEDYMRKKGCDIAMGSALDGLEEYRGEGNAGCL
jgi:aspartate aminotransferase-like enzyme